MLTAMARELVTQKGVGERADDPGGNSRGRQFRVWRQSRFLSRFLPRALSCPPSLRFGCRRLPSHRTLVQTSRCH